MTDIFTMYRVILTRTGMKKNGGYKSIISRSIPTENNFFLRVWILRIDEIFITQD